ncbi:MAG: VWA domain-containing protein [Alphaproteobacteria bacterium]|nr:VWA domain-containing protein [Alphaproteobacteria bacterium]
MPALLLPLLLATGTARADLDVAFVLDTTGSMSGELREARARVRELAEALAAARPDETIRFGVVAYRDRGDAYVTRTSPLMPEVDGTWRFLNGLDANGGGDAPEDVIAGVVAALDELAWDPQAEHQLFLIGDAPAQTTYDGHPDVHALAARARAADVVVHTIGCRSLSGDGIDWFRTLAYETEGRYHHIGRVEADSGGLAEAMLQTLAPAPGDDGPREALTVHESRRRGADSTGAPFAGGVVVRPGTWWDAAEAEPDGPGDVCSLTVMVPDGMDLSGPPKVWTGSARMGVELALAPGDGSRTVWELSRCVPPATAIETVLN